MNISKEFYILSGVGILLGLAQGIMFPKTDEKDVILFSSLLPWGTLYACDRNLMKIETIPSSWMCGMGFGTYLGASIGQTFMECRQVRHQRK